ncbi:MAG: bifunctional 4-hydroxy-2-oxoglutarate aldolase/2-dehydro-3-deoxy-phosphogluconate aldolase [Deltaproteobacteria bacterium]|nr:MAG: bifunctional 4-hydroxy-2-oxoglutarate aldolase/2-dehydro-3-deoxy-phosphogluconate aldolase [Deltaproteobacteria bacterium]
MNKQELFDELAQYRVIPVIAIDDVQAAVPMADALIEGGLPVAEITFRTAAAGEVMATLKRERPNLILGAGTILSIENLRLANQCGAQFGVAPGFNPKIVEEAGQLNMPFIPGVATPSDIETAMGFGLKVLKFFPAGALGGDKMVKALSGPYAHMGVQFVPTGGVNLQNLESYLSLPTVAMVGGTWIAKKDAIAGGKWDQIRENCRQVCSLVAQIRKCDS